MIHTQCARAPHLHSFLHWQVDLGGEVWLGPVAPDPERPNAGSGRLVQNDRKQRANNSETKSAFAGSGQKSAIAFCKVRSSRAQNDYG